MEEAQALVGLGERELLSDNFNLFFGSEKIIYTVDF